MKLKKSAELTALPASIDTRSVASTLPIATALSYELPKPKDWQVLQRSCAVLFRLELKDPNVQEYGRNGQDQAGIDILGKRNQDSSHYVGIQCRLIKVPNTLKEILDDCLRAVKISPNLREIIFATTAPDDVASSNAAMAAEVALLKEGFSVSVTIYGWEALQNLVALHPEATAVFNPSSVATLTHHAQSEVSLSADSRSALLDELMERLAQPTGFRAIVDPFVAGSNAEDPDLHARIDIFRDVFKQGDVLVAKAGLINLRDLAKRETKPWAHFRIQTNLGAIALDLGREDEAASHFEAAYAARPDDTNAMTNLALARICQGRPDEGMSLAEQALKANPPAPHAITALLQAAARSKWEGEPESLIPVSLTDTVYADIGLAEFLRFRNIPGWPQRNLDLADRYPDQVEFRPIAAVAILSLSVDSGRAVPSAATATSFERMTEAADHLLKMAEHHLSVDYADRHDLLAYINNAGVMLRLCGRHAECETLLKAGLPKLAGDPPLTRLLALTQAALGRRGDAATTLSSTTDPESHILHAEIMSYQDPLSALQAMMTMELSSLTPHHQWLRWQLIGDIAVRTNKLDLVQNAVIELRRYDPDDVYASILEIRGEKQGGLDEEKVRDRFRSLGISLSSKADLPSRFFLAEELANADLPEVALVVLEGRIDLTRAIPPTKLYLRVLASARRDEAFRTILAGSLVLREDPDILWMAAIQSWNSSDLPGASEVVEHLLARQPDNSAARLLKIEILLRQNKTSEVLAELDKPLERLPWSRLSDQLRAAGLLGAFGYAERAASLAYRLFLEHRDDSRAWLTLSMLVLGEGRHSSPDEPLWVTPVVGIGTAVDLHYGDGEKFFFVVEESAALRKIDSEAREPQHQIVATLLGLPQGSRFREINGREGVIAQIRHKYVARFHYVLANIERRFPHLQGFRSISVAPGQEGGLDELLASLKSRRDWCDEQQKQYLSGPWPLGLLAESLGVDTIDVAHGLASQGAALKVATGGEAERHMAARAIRRNSKRGCVLDLLAFWTAWKLGALPVVLSTCGTVHVPQSLFDRLLARRERLAQALDEGMRQASYVDGKIALQEIGSEVVRSLHEDVDQAISWIAANAVVCPVVVGDAVPDDLREHLRLQNSDMFHALVVAIQSNILLICDDLPTRELGRSLHGRQDAWMHQVFSVALDTRIIDADTYTRWSANLIEAGHSYLGVSSMSLGRALILDAKDSGAPGRLFDILTNALGGKTAEARSHIEISQQFLNELWSRQGASAYRHHATALLMSKLLRYRHDDYAQIVAMMLLCTRRNPQLFACIRHWAKLYFIPEEMIAACLRSYTLIDGPQS